MTSTQTKNSWLRIAIFGSLTLGLAPFFPEPHIVGKIRWILGGAVGMKMIDWFDFLFHGAPWFLLIALLVYKGLMKVRAN